MKKPTAIPILGNPESIVVDNNIWPEFIIEDLLHNVSSSTYLLVTDTNLFSIYGSAFLNAFQTIAARIKPEARLLTYQIAPGETSKSRTTKDEAIDWMLSGERDPPLDTKSVIIALGGGVIGDLFGYVAAVFKRGMRFVNVPTSLLAMVDSSIGGKTAIDTPVGYCACKNPKPTATYGLIFTIRLARILKALSTSLRRFTLTYNF